MAAVRERIRIRRREKRLSQAELAYRGGMSERTLLRIEKRQKTTDVKQVEKLAEVLETSSTGLLGLDAGPAAQLPLTEAKDEDYVDYAVIEDGSGGVVRFPAS